MKKNTKKGFTLVELVIVIAVIAILSAILIPTFGDIISNANETAYQKAADSGFTEALDKYATKVSFDYAIVVYYDGGLKAGTEEGFYDGTATRAYKIDASKNITLIATKDDLTITNVTDKKPTIPTTIKVTSDDSDIEANEVTAAASKLYYINDKVAIAFFKAAA